MTEPNPRQRELIEGLEGIHLVDAGAGTGKTFAVTRRYAAIVERPGVEPDDVLLVTFTRNAATEMKERVVARSSYGMRDLRDAPIRTFHGHCHDLLLEHGFEVPRYLGIDDRITDAVRILDDDLIEEEAFRTFYGRFIDEHPSHEDLARVVDSPMSLLELIRKLAAKGVFPTEDGWYRDGERHLDGDEAAFRAAFAAANRPRNDGRKQSRLRSKLASYGRDACYLPNAPGKGDVRGDGKAVPADVARAAFEEDRTRLKAFVHDVYHGYLAHALSRNYLTFGMLQLYAYVLLCEDHRLRETLAFEHVMVDEFQDTSEIQFKLALLACGTDNLCVVGDWKQSIYGFQYADVENIIDFEARLDRFVEELNTDHERVAFEDRSVERVEFEENYRSTQAVLDLAEKGLTVPATATDDVDVAEVRDRVVPLRASRDHERTRLEAFRHEKEHDALLTTLQTIVGNDEYSIEDDGEFRPPGYGDIAVLTRTQAFGRELLHAAEGHGMPMAYEGGIELFRTDQAKLLLAWLRILENDIDRGWAVVLERAGYTMDEIAHLLESGAYPDDMASFKEELGELEGIGAVAERVFARYGYDGTTADVVLETVQDAHDATTMTRGDLVRFLERGIEAGATREVSAPAGTDAVTVQTIHAAKGLEYPIVVLANMNRYAFPPSGGGRGTITYEDPIGLRQRKVYAEVEGRSHVYDDWRTDVMFSCLGNDYAEERRLLYVAMTRARDHLVFTAGEEPNAFLEGLPLEVEEVAPDVRPDAVDETIQSTLEAVVPPPEGPVGWNPHELMSDAVFESLPEGAGADAGSARQERLAVERGRRVHAFAEAYAEGDDVAPADEDEQHVATLIDSVEGTFHVEEDAYLPLTVDGERVTISGVVDLVAVTDDRVELYDFKTDRYRHAEEEYRTQLSVYYHVLDRTFPDRPVSASLVYTKDGDVVPIEPLTIDELVGILRRRRSTGDGS